MTKDILISYSRRDQEFITCLAGGLNARSVEFAIIKAWIR
jgi:hypothetical protein